MAAEGDRCVVRRLSIEDLLGGNEPDDATNAPLEIGPSPDLKEVIRGVTVTWLMDAFRMDRRSVRKKLADLAPLKYGKGNTPIYDFVQACSYLVKPKVDIAKYIKTLKAEELPLDLQGDYWDALLKKQKWEERAGELWRTNDVIEVFGEVLKHVKTSTQLWANTIDRKTGLTTEQYAILEKLTDALLDDIHKRLSEMETKRKTPSTAAALEEPDEV